MTIPAELKTMGVMLASPGKNPDVLLQNMLSEDRWTFEIKWDGVRAVAYVEDGVATLCNRKGDNITHQYPEVIEALQRTFTQQSVVLDGEMLVFQDGRPSFNLLQQRNANHGEKQVAALSQRLPATFMAFDIICDNGLDLRRVLQIGRHILLEKAAQGFDSERLMVTPSSNDGAMMWRQVTDLGLEGLIAKQRTGIYESRRSPAWVKLKPTFSVTAIAHSYEFGKKGGARANTLGALFLGLVSEDGESLVDAGKCGTGFKQRELAVLMERIDAWRADPANNPPLLVEIEYQELLDSGKLRFPTFKAVRDDQTWADCSVDQLS